MTRSYRAIKNPHPKAIIIHCGDPRFRIAFREFIAEGLGLNQIEFVSIVIAGGPAALAHPRKKHGDCWFIMDQIRFFQGHFKSIEKIIVIGHQDCGYYKTIDHPDPKDREKNDLPIAADFVKKTVNAAIVKPFYANFTDENHTEIVFKKM